MTVCNMSIEAGARAGHDRPRRHDVRLPRGPPARPARARTGTRRSTDWRTLRTDDDAVFDNEVVLDAADARAVRHVGHQPRPGPAAVGERPRPRVVRRRVRPRARPHGPWSTWASQPGTPLRDIAVDTVFIGSCTNGRIEDLRAAAEVVKGRQVADGVRMLVVPGSTRVRLQAEAEGLDQVFTAAGAEWRQAGCSMCLGMNPDQLAPGERSASTSNRNFEGRQGKGGRTHLVSPPSPPPPRCAAPSPAPPTSETEGNPSWTRSRRHTGIGVPLRRSNVDTDQIIPADYLKRVDPHRLRGRPVRGLARRRDLRPQQPALRRRLGPRRRARLRHRLLARARRLGPDGLRLPGRHLLAVRRHLPRQLRQGGPADGAGGPGRRRAAVEAARERAGDRGHRRPAQPHHHRQGHRGSRSRSTTTPAGGCSRASTTSA